MPLDIPENALIEKNKLHGSSAWLILLKITYPGEESIRIANNNVNIDWPSIGGNTYYACPFKISGDTQDNEGTIPELSLSLFDFSRLLIPIVDKYSGGIGAIVNMYLVLSEHLDESDPVYSLDFEITDTNINSKYEVTFKLGASNPMKYRIPQDKYLKDFCRYTKDFKGSLCTYSGIAVSCNGTLARCRELENSHRFGGFPGVGSDGFTT